MAAAYTELYEFTMPELPGCDKPLILQTIKSILTHFFLQTYYWQEDLDAINILADVAEYDLDSTRSNALIIVPVKVVLDDAELQPGSNYEMPTTTRIKLLSTPAAASTAGLEIKAALKPKRGATSITDELFNRWYETWAFGVKARLMNMPKKSWSDRQTAAIYDAFYWDGIAEARVAVTKGKADAQLLATARWNFA